MILGDGDDIGQQIQQWRTNLGLTMAEAARLCNVPATVWSRIESGTTPNPTYRTIAAMFMGLGAVIEVKMTSMPKPPDPPQLPLKTRKSDNRVHADA